MLRYAKFTTAVFAAALLGACASGPVITPTGQANTYVITTQAAGGSLAWGRAWNQANDRAAEFCKQRGMLASTKLASTSGFGAMETHEATLTFTCHPDWVTAGKN
ncbi:hypothetical protein FAZ95_17620 [Trinickia violacea]|uniref:DUF4156 domain-containing protein n=1 Tax=Trinickia violacea TaxID=2571746 RepID=A0A4P8IRK8_9BURK|nr:hypothetical protein [Trinickia violacea]QCP50811.1 hypothetical protein FAZ95_17620 [Trinickia violacea]